MLHHDLKNSVTGQYLLCNNTYYAIVGMLLETIHKISHLLKNDFKTNLHMSGTVTRSGSV